MYAEITDAIINNTDS